MNEYIALDSHLHYSLAEREEIDTGRTRQQRLEHHAGAIRDYLRDVAPGTAVAVEATGSWYWIVQEIEQAGAVPRLIHPRKAKLMMGLINKTDKLDVHGFNRLQRTGTLPTVWIPPANLRDLRELTRLRMALVRQRTQIKNRISATLAKYGLSVGDWSDRFGKSARVDLEACLAQLPEHTAWSARTLLTLLDDLQKKIRESEERLEALLQETPDLARLRTLPGVGPILSALIALEVGDVSRFASAEHLASYAGTTPRVHSSGDKTRHGRLRSDVNRYLKWAFVEAANVSASHAKSRPDHHVSRLYQRLRQKKGHAKAVGAVARHLAEATFHVLSRQEDYKEPARWPVPPVKLNPQEPKQRGRTRKASSAIPS